MTLKSKYTLASILYGVISLYILFSFRRHYLESNIYGIFTKAFFMLISTLLFLKYIKKINDRLLGVLLIFLIIFCVIFRFSLSV